MQTKRNEKCHCGSGQKFKKCCGSPDVLNAKRAAERAAWEEARRKRLAELEAKQQESPAPRKPLSGHSPIIGALLIGSLMATSVSSLGRTQLGKSYHPKRK